MKKRLFFFPLFASALGFSAFLRTADAEHVRTVQIVALIATGMGLGVALAHLKFVLDTRFQR
ncbi:MAG: hypothetical protein ACHP7J_06150 [Terriglobales bacterium]